MNKQVTIFFSVILLLTSCNFFSPETKNKPRDVIGVKIAVIDSTASQIIHSYVGKIEENSIVELSFPQGGNITTIYKKTGEKVHKNELIAEIEKSDALNAYNVALASKKQAEDAYNRLKKIYEKGAISEVKWVEIITNRDKACSLAELAHKRLKNCELRSTSNGIIDKIEAEIGSNLLPNQRFASLIDVNTIQVVFSVPEFEIGQMKIGRTAEVEISALNDEIRQGEIVSKSMIAHKLSHNYEVKISLQNSDQQLLPGMTCKVKLKQNRGNTLIVPNSAIQTRPEGPIVWHIKHGKAFRQAILPTEYVENGVRVDAGISHGDSVVIEGQSKLYEGVEVLVMN